MRSRLRSMWAAAPRGLYVPTTSTGRPLRARSFSITTTRYCGCLRAPVRARRIISTESLVPFFVSGLLELPAGVRQTHIFPEFSGDGKEGGVSERIRLRYHLPNSDPASLSS